MHAASATVPACAPRHVRKRDAARVPGSASRASRAEPARAASATASVDAASETNDVPRGDTAGAMMVLRDVRVTVGDRDLLVDANLRVEPGEVVGLVGANGCEVHVAPRGVRLAGRGRGRAARGAERGGGVRLRADRRLRLDADGGGGGASRMTHVRDAERALRDAEAGIAAGAKGAESAFLAAQERWGEPGRQLG